MKDAGINGLREDLGAAMAARCWASGAVRIGLFCRGRRCGAFRLRYDLIYRDSVILTERSRYETAGKAARRARAPRSLGRRAGAQGQRARPAAGRLAGRPRARVRADATP